MNKDAEAMHRGREVRDIKDGDDNSNNGYVSRAPVAPRRSSPPQSQHSRLAVQAILNNINTAASSTTSQHPDFINTPSSGGEMDKSLKPPSKTVAGRALGIDSHHHPTHAQAAGVGRALSDTPISTAPPSPQM